MADEKKRPGGWRGVKPPHPMPRKKYQRKHDELYWARLKRDFQTCSYHNGGGYLYLTTGPPEFGDNVESFRVQVHLNDAVAEKWADDNPGSEQEQIRRRRFKNILALRYEDEIIGGPKKPLD